jgi:hypothetical protein
LPMISSTSTSCSIALREDFGLWAAMLNIGARCKDIDCILVHASAGDKMYKRRSGWSSFAAEYYVQRHLMSDGVTKGANAFFTGYCVV